MKEEDVERRVRAYIRKTYEKHGWKIPKKSAKPKKRGQHGADILMFNKGYGGYYTIEVKKYSDRPAQNYTTFYSLFGQILSRINVVPSKNYCKKKWFVVAAPISFVRFMHNLIHKHGKTGMLGGWLLFGKATNLKVWAVNMARRDEVKEYSWKAFIRNKL
jgi:hypothetical protein